MTIQRDKFLTEQVLGDCWHEASGMSWICGNCKADVGWNGSIENAVDVATLNHDSSTPEGFFKLWNAAQTKDWWDDFLNLAGVGHSAPMIKAGEENYMFIYPEFIHSDRFADALYEFLKERE